MNNGLVLPSTNGFVPPQFTVAVYARTSTLGQAEEDKISIPDQIQWAKNLCAERGWEFFGSYVDTLPGDIEVESRPQGNKLLEDARFKLFNLVLFYHSSRLAREPWVGLKTISTLGKYGVQIYIRNAPTEPVPPHSFIPGNNTGSEYINAFSLVGDKQENIARGERVTSGFKNLAQRGTLTFGAYGLKKISKIEILPNGKQKYTWNFEREPFEASIVEKIYDEYSGGKSLRKIVKGLINDKIPSPSGKVGEGSWSATTIRNILSDPVYIKKVRWGRKLGSKYRQGKSDTGKQKRVLTSSATWILVKSTNSPMIIGENVFYKTQELLKQRGKIAGRQLASKSLLVGLIWCGKCNLKAYCKTRKVKKNGHVYIRSDFIDQSYFRGMTCRRHLISSSKLEQLVLAKLQSRLEDLKLVDIESQLSLEGRKTDYILKESLRQINKQLKTYENKKTRLLDLYISSGIDRKTYDTEKDKLDSEETLLIQEQAKIQSLLNDQKKQKNSLTTLKQLLEMFEKVENPLIRKEMIQRILDKIVLYEDHVELIYKYAPDIATAALPNVSNVKPQPCGYLGDNSHTCSCSAFMIMRYQKRISGPMLDRIDIHLDVPAVKVEKLTNISETINESSKIVRNRVQKARDMQTKRFAGTSLSSNSDMSNRDIKLFCALDESCIQILRLAVDKMKLSARSYHRIIKLARTIADLEQLESIDKKHIAEALQYRPKVDNLF